VSYLYDGFGQKSGESLPTKVGGTPRFAAWTYEADGFLKTTISTKGVGVTTATFSRPEVRTLNGATVFVSSVQGLRGLPRKTWVDLLGQTIQQQDAKGQLATMAFDAFGRLIEARRGSQVRSYTYNTMGWLLSQTQPEEGTTLFSGHTVTGMPLIVSKGTGTDTTTTTTTLYQAADGGNREGLPKQITASGLGSTVTRLLDYDGARRLASLIETQGNGSVSETYGYDDLSRLFTKTISDGTAAFTVSREFDAFGKVVKLNYPAGYGKTARASVPGYDALHRPQSLAFGGSSVLTA
jgi:YD repeat-containing protein